MVADKKGYLVRTAGFDATMLAIGNALYPDKIGAHETAEYLEEQTNIRIANYEEEYKKLIRPDEIDTDVNKKEVNLSESEFRKEVEKIEERGIASEEERKNEDKITAWDYYRQGNRFFEQEKYGEAIESFSNAINKQSMAVFYFARGRAKEKSKRYQDAIEDYSNAISMSPDKAEYCNQRGYVYGIMEQWENALVDFEKSLELNPQAAHVYNNRGYVYSKIGEFDKAISDLEKAISCKNAYANPYKHLGTVWKNIGDLERAVKFFTKAIELKHDYKEAYIERAEAYRKMGELQKAQEDEEEAAKLS